jgi:hypothetical protein
MTLRNNILTPLCLAAMAALWGCDDNPASSSAPALARSIVSVNATADQSEGNTALYDIDSAMSFPNLLQIDPDNLVKAFNGSVYIIERTTGNIIKVDGSNISDDNAGGDHFGSGKNLHDIAFVSSTKAYVTQYDAAEVAVYNPSSGKKTQKSISLAQYAPDGAQTPNMDAAVYHQGRVYVGLQKFSDDFSALGASSVIVLDTDRDSVAKEIILDAKNPQGMSVFGDKLYIACTGKYADDSFVMMKDGGVVVIDLTDEASEGVLVNEEALGGNVGNVIVVSETRGYAVVSGADWSNAIVPFDPATGAVGQPLAFVDNAAQYGLAYDGTHLYVGDRSTSDPGLLVVDPSNNSRVSGPHDLGMPPNAIALLEVER